MICFKGSPPEVFHYKGFLQISSKLTGEHPRGNVNSERHLNGRVMLLKGAILFHQYITSSTKTFLWLQENAANNGVNYGEIMV